MSPSPKISISASQMRATECRLAWFWQYKQGWRPKEPVEALAFGTAVHSGLEAHYKGDDALMAFGDSWHMETKHASDKLDKAKNHRLGTSMLANYIEEYGQPEDETFEVIKTEQFISRPIPTPKGEPSGFWLNGRIDAVVAPKEADDLKVVLEHKTYSSLDRDSIQRDMQFSIEIWLAQADYLIYNGLRKVGKKASPNSPALFHREDVERNEREIEIMLHRAYNMVKEYVYEDPEIYPQPSSMKCRMCEFKDPCMTYLKGGDYLAVLEDGFFRRVR